MHKGKKNDKKKEPGHKGASRFVALESNGALQLPAMKMAVSQAMFRF